MSRNGSPYASMAERLAANSVTDPETGCRLWTAAVTADGYPRMTVWCKTKKRSITVFAHRMAFATFVGPIPVQHDIDHRQELCRHRSCIEPTHLRPQHYYTHRIGTAFSRRANIPKSRENAQAV